MEKVITIGVTGVLVLVFAVLIAFPTGAIVMLALGILHDEWPQIPAFGFWASFLLTTIWRLLWPFSTSKKDG